MEHLFLLEWLIPLEPSVTVMAATCVTAILYLRGCRTQQLSSWRIVAFWFGLLLMYLIAQTQFDYYSEHAFFMHRIQQSVLHHVGPFLIALSSPGVALSAGLPANWRKNPGGLPKLKSVTRVVRFLNNPIVAVTLFCGVIFIWLPPPIHIVAMLDWHWYRIMNWSMAINGLMFWNLVLNSYSIRPAHLSAGCRIAMMLAVIPPQIVAGALLVFASREQYPIYSLCGAAFPLINWLLDQQIGGMILWIHGAMMSVIGILFVMYTEWMHPKRQ
jgi:putative membrane protein